MSISKSITSAVVAASLVAGSMLPLATAANADSWGNRHSYSANSGRDWNVGSDRRYRGFQQYRAPRQDYRAYNSYRDDRREHRRDRKVARGVAIGLGVLMLGAILSQAGNHHSDRYDY